MAAVVGLGQRSNSQSAAIAQQGGCQQHSEGTDVACRAQVAWKRCKEGQQSLTWCQSCSTSIKSSIPLLVQSSESSTLDDGILQTSSRHLLQGMSCKAHQH